VIIIRIIVIIELYHIIINIYISLINLRVTVYCVFDYIFIL